MRLRRLGLVDLGSNTARLVVYEYERGRGFRLADEIREVVRLGEGIARRGRMRKQNMETALAALGSFADFARATKLPKLKVLATSAVREAGNGDEFLDRMLELGLDAKVLSGTEEAKLGVLAVGNTSRFRDAWVMDLGGGSVQLSCMRERRFVEGGSAPLGALRCSEAFLQSDPVKRTEVEALEAEVDRHLGERLEQMRQDGMPLVAMGGTVRNLASAVARHEGSPWPLVHAYSLRTEALAELTERMIDTRTKSRGKIPGINSYRADTILAGAIVYRRVAERAGLEEIVISGFGVREGTLFRALLAKPHLLENVRRFSVENLLWHYPQPEKHTRQVRHLAARLFDELEPLHGLGDEDRQLLDAASALHDIGKTMGYRDHSKHGEYLVASAPMPGFSQREQALISLLVRYHRGGKPKVGAYRPMLREDDAQRLQQLCACLRLAEYLERTRSGRVRDVAMHLGSSVAQLEVEAQGSAQVECWETQRQAPIFRRAFGRRLQVETGD